MPEQNIKLKLPKWYDLHAHFRQDDFIPPLLKAHKAMGCAGIVAMPNTSPPVAKVLENDPLPYWSIESYLEMIRNAGGSVFNTIIVPLYLSQDTTPKMIEDGAKSGILKAAKYYPPHGTTGAEFSTELKTFIDNGVFSAMEEANITLCIHGEEHNLSSEMYFGRKTNAEEYFYSERLPQVLDSFPNLKIVSEHLTTKVSVNIINQAGKNVAASITPQHLLYTIGDLLQGLKYHLYCLPLLKFEEDREALLHAITSTNNTKFFAGTDSAPHAIKATKCGCAAGCYTGGIAPQLYAQAFELSGINLGSDNGAKIFENFLCTNGANFYNLKTPIETFTLEKTPQTIKSLKIGSKTITPLPLGLDINSDNSTEIPWSILK